MPKFNAEEFIPLIERWFSSSQIEQIQDVFLLYIRPRKADVEKTDKKKVVNTTLVTQKTKPVEEVIPEEDTIPEDDTIPGYDVPPIMIYDNRKYDPRDDAFSPLWKYNPLKRGRFARCGRFAIEEHNLSMEDIPWTRDDIDLLSDYLDNEDELAPEIYVKKTFTRNAYLRWNDAGPVRAFIKQEALK